MAKKKRVKRKLKWKFVLKLFCVLFFFGMACLYVKELKTTNIIIKGNSFVSDHEIILASGFKNYPNLFDEKKKDLEKKIKEIPYIEEVKIKRSLSGTLTIQVKEASPLFYNRNNNKLVLENKKEIESASLNGVPILINYVPSNYYEKLIEKLSTIDPNVRGLISEIEYQPWKSNDVMIDETRFFLRMNDGNSVYVNLIHLDKLNNYIEIFSSLEGKLGILYLDSSSDKISFSEYKVGES